MDKPVSCKFIPERQTSLLFFKDKEAEEYCVRGALCFPVLVDAPGGRDVVGYALVGCQDVKGGAVHVFEQKDFTVIDHIVKDGRIQHTGLSQWLNKVWSKYYCRKFFFSQDYELSKKYRLDIHRSVMVEPKPVMIEIETHDDYEMQHTIWSYVKTARVIMEAGSVLFQKLQQLKQGDKQVHPAIYALQVLLCGFDRFPYRKKEIE